MPRLLPCGHAFCEGCLSRMLRCAPRSSHALSLGMGTSSREKLKAVTCCWLDGLNTKLSHARRGQATPGERGWEAAGVPEVPRTLHRQGWRRAHTPRGLRHAMIDESTLVF